MRLVGVNAKVSGDRERFCDDFGGSQFSIALKSQCGRLGIRTTRADCSDSFFRFKYIAVSCNDQGGFPVGDQKHGFETSQHAVGPPVFGKLNG